MASILSTRTENSLETLENCLRTRCQSGGAKRGEGSCPRRPEPGELPASAGGTSEGDIPCLLAHRSGEQTWGGRVTSELMGARVSCRSVAERRGPRAGPELRPGGGGLTRCLTPGMSLKPDVPRGAPGSSDKRGHVPSSGQSSVFRILTRSLKMFFMPPLLSPGLICPNLLQADSEGHSYIC